ncbi:MAG: S1 family peptidase [Firmicutes bacterium]|nr:S1 family peptidase [Bacillota bacterium]
MKTKKKKLSTFMLVLALICNMVLGTGMLYSPTANYAYANQLESIEELSQEQLDASARSLEISGEFFQKIRAEITTETGEKQMLYDDNFAGIFIDKNGILNIATIADGTRVMQSSISQFGEQVIHKQFTYSYNHLLHIKDTIFPFLYTQGVFTLAIDEVNNRVSVYVTDYSYKLYVIEYLQAKNLYTATSICFIIEPIGGNLFTSRAIHSGDDIRRQIGANTWTGGTIGAQAVCNITGQLGVLTNEHVISRKRMDRAFHTNATTFPIGQPLRGIIGGTIDASFIPFENQNAWVRSAYARQGLETFRNIRLGRENQILVGALVRRLGRETGNTIGTIQNRNISTNMTTADGESHRLSNVFRLTNYAEIGDSGGPVYIRNGNNLYLIGLTFATTPPGVPVRFAYACRITNVMRELDVTIITNDPLPLVFDVVGGSHITGWEVRMRNRNNFAVDVTYNNRMAFESAARNFSGLNSTHRVVRRIGANSSITVQINSNELAGFITAGIHFRANGREYKVVSYANEIRTGNRPSMSVNTIVTPYAQPPPVNGATTPRHLWFEVVYRRGFLFYDWWVRINNPNNYWVEITYNHRMVFQLDASNFRNLSHRRVLWIAPNGHTYVWFESHAGATTVVAAIYFQISGRNYRQITYANGLRLHSLLEAQSRVRV